MASRIHQPGEAGGVPANLADILSWDSHALGHLATIDHDGMPHTTPVWFLWDGERLWVSVTSRRKKYRNIIANPRVAVSVVDESDPLRYVQIRGLVDSIEPDPRCDLIAQLSVKYLGTASYPWHEPGDIRKKVAIRPVSIGGVG